MLWKLIFIIICIGAIGMGLLILRQQKIETVHDISVAYRRQRQSEHTLWKLQAELDRRCRTDELQRRLEELGLQWRKIPASSPNPVARPVPLVARPENEDELALGG